MTGKCKKYLVFKLSYLNFNKLIIDVNKSYE